MIQVKKIAGPWNRFVPEYQSDNELVLSKAGRLYWCDRQSKGLSVMASARIGSFFESSMARFPLLARLFRLQFYNVIRCDGGWFVAWAKKLYFLDKNGVKHHLSIAGRSFRVFRNGAFERNGCVYFGEYFGNPERDAVNLYRFDPRTLDCSIIHTFPAGSIRHVHAVRPAGKTSMLVFAGDVGEECRILLLSGDGQVQTLISGSEESRAIYGILEEDGGLIYATDAELMKNQVMHLRNGELKSLHTIDGPVFFGADMPGRILLSVTVEGAQAQLSDDAQLLLLDKQTYELTEVFRAPKDRLSKRYFQFGQILLPYRVGVASSVYFSTLGLIAKKSGLHVLEIT